MFIGESFPSPPLSHSRVSSARHRLAAPLAPPPHFLYLTLSEKGFQGFIIDPDIFFNNRRFLKITFKNIFLSVLADSSVSPFQISSKARRCRECKLSPWYICQLQSEPVEHTVARAAPELWVCIDKERAHEITDNFKVGSRLYLLSSASLVLLLFGVKYPRSK